MSSYQRAVWVPEENEKYFMYLSCNEYNYVLRDYIGEKEHKGDSSELPELIKKTRFPLKSTRYTEREAWIKYLLNLSKELESDKNQEEIEPELRQLLARRERYDMILKTLCEDARDDQIIYEKIIVDHCPEDRFPFNCKEVCEKGRNSLYQKGKNQLKEKEIKRLDFCGIVNGRVRILIEEESEQGKHLKYLNNVIKGKYLKTKGGVKWELKNVFLFIVEDEAKTEYLPNNKTEPFSHIIICNNEDFPEEYEKIKGYI